jgi:adenylate cyclase
VTSPTRKIAAILVSDVVGYSRLAAADEERTLARLRALHGDLIDPLVAAHHGRLVKRTGDGSLVEFRSVLDAVRCAIGVQQAIPERNTDVAPERRIEFRIGVHVGDIVEESDGDLMGDGVNIAARLEGVCNAGGVCISEDAYRQVRDKVSATFIDLGEKSLKNIPRPIRVYRVVFDEGNRRKAPGASPSQSDLPEKPSIAVLPFQNMSGDPEQEYFADGIVEDIITGLSRIKWLFVIARNSSFIYKGRAIDVRQVGRELGVRYVLEGGVRKAGSRVRITAQLIEAETGAHLWADKYDGPLEDIFDLQDRITDRVVAIVEPSLQRSEIERSRRKRPENLDAYDLYLRALPHVAAQMPVEATKAVALLEQALALDPNYASAHALLAWSHELCFARDGFDERHRNAAVTHARATIASNTDDPTTLAVAGFVLSLLGRDPDTALAAIDRALSLNASSATALYLAAQAHALLGRAETATSFANRALRLSPFDSLAFQAHMALGESALIEGRLDDAALSFAKAAQTNPNFSTAYLFEAIALALAGRLNDARPVARRGIELEPGFDPRVFSEHGLAPALIEKLTEGLSLLDLPRAPNNLATRRPV